MGVQGVRVTKQEGDGRWHQGFLGRQRSSVDGGSLWEKKVPVLPMVPGGKALDDFIIF